MSTNFDKQPLGFSQNPVENSIIVYWQGNKGAVPPERNPKEEGDKLFRGNGRW